MRVPSSDGSSSDGSGEFVSIQFSSSTLEPSERNLRKRTSAGKVFFHKLAIRANPALKWIRESV